MVKPVGATRLRKAHFGYNPAMAAKIIDGNALAASIKEQVRARSQQLKAEGRVVHLAALLVGNTPAAEMYAKRQAEACADVGIDYELVKLPADARVEQANATIDRLNQDESISGIMVHQPLPQHIDSTALLARISAVKDVEGVSPASLGHLLLGTPLNVPCTALAAVECILSTGVSVRGAEVVVVGASEIVGKPAALLLSDQRATVSICRSATRDLAGHTRRAQILIAAVGKPHFIRAEHVAEGTVVIDVGINRVTLPDGSKKTLGDVEFESVAPKASFITPVPGGVGPLTVAMLLRNAVRSSAAGQKQH